jgi:hypothetical protein
MYNYAVGPGFTMVHHGHGHGHGIEVISRLVP